MEEAKRMKFTKEQSKIINRIASMRKIDKILAEIKKTSTKEYFEDKLDFVNKVYIEKDIENVSRWQCLRIKDTEPSLINRELMGEKMWSEFWDNVESAKSSV